MVISNFFISFINLIILGFGSIVKLLFSVLPPSPFRLLDSSAISEHLATLNYFVPISSMITASELWLASISVYYLYQIVMRWIKAIN